MNCKEARASAIEHLRSGSAVLDPHFETCAECSRFLRAQLALHSAFAALSRDVPAPADMETQLLAEFDAVARNAVRNAARNASGDGSRLNPRPAARRFGWWLPAAALAASLAIVAVAIHHPVPEPRIAAEPFVEIPYIAPLAPYERTKIVRMDVPVSALIAAGFEVHAVDTGAALSADVLFGQDGRAHAIRLVSNSVPNSN
jgi:hypothetical protein